MKKLITTLMLSALLLTPVINQAATGGALADNKTTTDAIRNETARQNELLKEINNDVADGIKHVFRAVRLLDMNKDKQAISALQAATGKFDVALAANPRLALIPVDSYVTVYNLAASADVIRERIDIVEELLEHGKVQQARELLSSLRDEMLINTVFLPMATYPDSVKLATRYLIDGKRDEAITILQTALTSTVSETAVIPLGLIRAKSLIEQAAEMVDDKEAALDFVRAAREQLEIARLLGYTSDESVLYEALNDQIDALEKEIKGKNIVGKLYDKLAKSFSELIGKESQPEKSTEKTDPDKQ